MRKYTNILIKNRKFFKNKRKLGQLRKIIQLKLRYIMNQGVIGIE